MSQGRLFVISAPSGTGKTSLLEALVEKRPQLRLSISHTTRPKRSDEVDGVNYFFIDRERFAAMIEAGNMLEYAEVFGEMYGTSKDWVVANLAAGRSIVLELDCQGAAQIRQQFPKAVLIFILPPSFGELRQRLEGRQQDASAVIARRLQQARHEVAQVDAFDYLVVNDSFEDALAQLDRLLTADEDDPCEEIKIGPQKKKYKKNLDSFFINA